MAVCSSWRCRKLSATTYHPVNVFRFWLFLCVTGCGRLNFDALESGDCSAFGLADAQVNLSTHVALRLTYAVEPVTFALDGPGELFGATFVSPAYRSTTRITATDADGCTATGTVVTAGKELFYISGTFNFIPTTDVWRSANAIDWTKIGNVPAPRVNGGVTVFHDALWYIGGSTDEGATRQTTVWTSTDGVTWTTAAPFPIAVTDTDAIAFRDRLWVIGGHGNPGGVWSSPDGQSWTNVGSLPSPLHGGQLIVLDDRMVYMGGHDDTNYYETRYASDDGVTWTQLGTLPSQREFQATAVHDRTVMFAGGVGPAGVLADSFWSSDTISWIQGGLRPAARSSGQLWWSGDRYYDIGGTDGGDVWSSIDGSSWEVLTTSLPHPRYGALLELTPH